VDFSPIELDEATVAFWRGVREWCAEHVTEAVLDEERATGAGLNQALHLALGEQGWIYPTWPPEAGGAGLDKLRAAIIMWELMARHAPPIGVNTSPLVVPAIEHWLDGDLRRDLLLGAARGELVFCLGYTEPDAGSDLAAARTRAVRDGDEWHINGQKMFTTGAQYCNYSFLLARTDPDAPKHKGLTMFLVPLDVPGVEIRAVHTLGGERTNMVFYDDVRVADKYRIGPVNQGWMVLHDPLDAEHRMDSDGSKPIEEQRGEATPLVSPLVDAVLAAVTWARRPDPDGHRPLDDPGVRARLAEIELGLAVAAVTPNPLGRVIRSDLFIRDAADLMDLVGPDALVERGQPGAVEGGAIEYAHRFAQGTAIYGGTTDIFRNIIAGRFLGMPRNRPAQTLK
jgi:alkylation response protein AidB-like acyl-CoA dehydrogenase